MIIMTFGDAAYKIGSRISELSSQYKMISYGNSDENTYKLEKKSSSEEYARMRNVPSQQIDEEHILVILSGSSDIGSITLPVLSKYKDKKITVLFNKTGYKTNKTCEHYYRVLCEYARSGAIGRLISFQNDFIQDVVGESNDFFNLYAPINSMISYIVHYLNISENSTPLMEEKGKKLKTANIQAIGLFELDSMSGVSFDELREIKEVEYVLFLKEASGARARQIRALQEKLKKDASMGIMGSLRLFKAETNEFMFFIEKTNQPKQ